MTMDEFKAWLNERIAILGPELERLLNARNAIERAEAELGADVVMHGLAMPIGLPRGIPGSKRSSGTRVTKTGVIKVQFNPEEWNRVLDEVVKLLGDGPLASGVLIHRIYPNKPTKKERDRVYAATFNLKAKGRIAKNLDGQWALTTAAVKEVSHG